MTPPLIEWPADDAPVREWCRPLSALMVNVREATGSSTVKPSRIRTQMEHGRTVRKIRRMIARKRRCGK